MRTATSSKRVRRNRRVTRRRHGPAGARRDPVRDPEADEARLWIIIKRGLTRRSNAADTARYAKRVRVPRTAVYRVFVNTGSGDIIAGFGPELTSASRGCYDRPSSSARIAASVAAGA